MVHYIGQSGFQGRGPSYAEVHGTFDAAVADLAERYDLEIDELEELSVDGRVELDIEYHEDEFLEIRECDCNRTHHHP